MASPKLITVREFCTHHQISMEFILQLQQYELIELQIEKRTYFIPESRIDKLEKIIRLHNDLEINMEGIQTIFHLLDSLEKKETELIKLKNQLAFYITEE